MESNVSRSIGINPWHATYPSSSNKIIRKMLSDDENRKRSPISSGLLDKELSP